jgi:hypothetical protein
MCDLADEHARITSLLQSGRYPKRWHNSYHAYVSYLDTELWYVSVGLSAKRIKRCSATPSSCLSTTART